VDCLDANAVQDLMAGALDPPARAEAMAHLDGCADCRDLLSLLAQDAARDAAIDTLRSAERTPAGAAAHPGGIGLVDTVTSATARAAIDPLALTGTPTGGGSLDLGARRVRAPSQAGRVLGRYTLGAPLGVGGMGVVYRAEDRELGRSVAVKLLHRPDPALVERLVREARAMAQISHPNVVAVYDAGVTDGTTYIAMELVTGSSLRAWQHAAPRRVPAIVEAYLAAGRGLAAAHAAGIVHRDFKPDNVLVGADGRVRVTDFGLADPGPAPADPAWGSPERPPRDPDSAEARDDAPAAADPLARPELTASGAVLGTPAYMAPEQFTGGNVDPRTDQFNFCVALYEALYGARPFHGRTFDELGRAVCAGAVLPPPVGTQVSRALHAIVRRGLAVRPGDRFPTMDHLLAELGRDRARPWRRAALAAAALAVALALGMVADVAIRDRVSEISARSFDANGRQIVRAFGLLAHAFDTNANQMYLQPAMRLAAAHRDQADFGLGTPEADAENLEKVHAELLSTDWTLWSRSVGSLIVAVADYKGRLLYTNAAPQRWQTELLAVPWVAALAAGKEKVITLQPTTEARLARSGILGPAPPARLGFFFGRALVLNQERAGYLIQAVDAAQLLDDIEIDDTLLSIAGVSGEHAGAVPEALVRAAPRDGGIAEVRHGGTLYQVKAQPLADLERRPVGHVIMARELGGVLAGWFPGARAAFALALSAALAAAALAAARARRIASASG
jgi:predicted Ser/Thr protein kinase